jgi:very-short-patch-repair endonuclease
MGEEGWDGRIKIHTQRGNDMTRGLIQKQKVERRKLIIAKEVRRVMTRAEKILWSCLRDNRLAGFHFRRQQILRGFIADFYCDSAGVVVEVDGGIHRWQTEADQFRDGVLKSLGLRVLRIQNREIEEDLETVLKRIESYCLEGEGMEADSLPG